MAAIRALREHLKMNQAEFAGHLAKSIPTVHRYERVKPPGPRELLPILKMAREARLPAVMETLSSAVAQEIPREYWDIFQEIALARAAFDAGQTIPASTGQTDAHPPNTLGQKKGGITVTPVPPNERLVQPSGEYLSAGVRTVLDSDNQRAKEAVAAVLDLALDLLRIESGRQDDAVGDSVPSVEDAREQAYEAHEAELQQIQRNAAAGPNAAPLRGFTRGPKSDAEAIRQRDEEARKRDQGAGGEGEAGGGGGEQRDKNRRRVTPKKAVNE
jgi:transcriptional regulator with XRE-family HTH domain